MKDLYAPRTRTALLSILLVVTGLVAYRTLASKTSSPAPDFERETRIVVHPPHIPHPPAPPSGFIPEEVRREVEAAMAEAAEQIESIRREIENESAEARAVEDAVARIEGIDLPAMSAVRGSERDEEAAIQKRFEVSAGGLLNVKVPGADVRVETGQSGLVDVEVLISGRDMKRAREQFERLRYEVYQSGNEIVVRTNRDRSFRWNSGSSGLRVRVVVRVPREFNADVSTSGGDITLEDLDGQVTLKTSGGDVEVGGVTGPDVSISTSGGDISVGRLESNAVHLSTSGGDITGELVDSRSIDARTSGGDIRFSAVYGRTKVRTSGGRIQVDGVRGDLDAATSGGRIEVTVLEEVPLMLRTSGGNIVIHAPRGLKAEVSLRGGSVHLDETFQVAGRVRRQSADGSINGGGARIDASTSGGSVSLLVRG